MTTTTPLANFSPATIKLRFPDELIPLEPEWIRDALKRVLHARLPGRHKADVFKMFWRILFNGGCTVAEATEGCKLSLREIRIISANVIRIYKQIAAKEKMESCSLETEIPRGNTPLPLFRAPANHNSKQDEPAYDKIAEIDVARIDVVLSAELATFAGADDEKQRLYEGAMQALTENMSVVAAARQQQLHPSRLHPFVNAARRAIHIPPLGNMMLRQFRRYIPIRTGQEFVVVPEEGLRAAAEMAAGKRGRAARALPDELVKSEMDPKEEEEEKRMSSPTIRKASHTRKHIMREEESGIEKYEEEEYEPERTIRLLLLSPAVMELRRPLKGSRSSVCMQLAQLLRGYRVGREEAEAGMRVVLVMAEGMCMEEAAASQGLSLPRAALAAKLVCLHFEMENYKGATEREATDSLQKVGSNTQRMQTCKRSASRNGRMGPSEANDLLQQRNSGLASGSASPLPHYIKLSAVIADMRVPMVVEDAWESLRWIGEGEWRASAKALLRLLLPSTFIHPQHRIKVQRLLECHLMDGESAIRILNDEKVKAFFDRLARLLSWLWREWPLYEQRMKKAVAIIVEEEQRQMEIDARAPRHSTRCKNRPSATPNFLYIDAVFKGEIKETFVTFIRKLAKATVPVATSLVVALAIQIIRLLPKSQEVSEEAIRDWVIYSFLPENESISNLIS